MRGSVVMNWSVWGEKQRTMPSAHPMKMKSSPRLMQLAEVVRNSTHLTNTFSSINSKLDQIMSYSLVEEAAVVELAEESRLGDGVGAVPHLAPPARHVAKVVIPLQVNFRSWIQLNSHTLLSQNLLI